MIDKTKKIRCVIFDLDGTLLSTLETITLHLNRALTDHGFDEISIDDTSKFIGNGARKLVTRAVTKNKEAALDTVLSVLTAYNRDYDSDPLPLTAPYPGIVDLVDQLYKIGIVIGVITNKPNSTARKLIEHFFDDKFAFVRGGREGATLKPDPADSLDAISSLGILPEECAFVGDTNVDIYTGKNMSAGLSVGVLWGFRSRDELIDAGADAIIAHPPELLTLLENKNED